jgi:hypothetical protein
MNMTKNEATKKIAELLAKNKSNLDEAVALANEHDVSFHFSTPDHTSITYVPDNGKRPTVNDYYENGWDESYGTEEEPWDQQYAGWQNSSTFC